MAEYIRQHKYFLIAIILVLTAVFSASRFYRSPDTLPNQDILTPSVQIDGIKIPVEVATSTTAIQQGLSGRTSLDANRGMIFVFSKPDKYQFWMPDMHFPIDIIWINNDKVVGITKNVSNEFDPANPILYTPPEPAQYVLEVNAGFAENRNINIGDEAVLNNINK